MKNTMITYFFSRCLNFFICSFLVCSICFIFVYCVVSLNFFVNSCKGNTRLSEVCKHSFNVYNTQNNLCSYEKRPSLARWDLSQSR
jgi:hypothetical protein